MRKTSRTRVGLEDTPAHIPSVAKKNPLEQGAALPTNFIEASDRSQPDPRAPSTHAARPPQGSQISSRDRPHDPGSPVTIRPPRIRRQADSPHANLLSVGNFIAFVSKDPDASPWHGAGEKEALARHRIDGIRTHPPLPEAIPLTSLGSGRIQRAPRRTPQNHTACESCRHTR